MILGYFIAQPIKATISVDITWSHCMVVQLNAIKCRFARLCKKYWLQIFAMRQCRLNWLGISSSTEETTRKQVMLNILDAQPVIMPVKYQVLR